MSRTVLAAYFAANKHRDQRRKDHYAAPYINHPLAVAYVLTHEVEGILDEQVVIGAILHDTIEDTETTHEELCVFFGGEIADLVDEVSDDKTLPKDVRKQTQIDHASTLSYKAKLIKLADKICNLRDILHSPPLDWGLERQQEYFDWSKRVVDAGLRDVHPGLENLFDLVYAQRP